MNVKRLTLCCIYLLAACVPSLAEEDLRKNPDLAQLAAWMTGTFSTHEQAAGDKAYHDLNLVVLPIWTNRRDGFWFYIEQAVSTKQDHPYRQRVYQLRPGSEPGTFETVVFLLNEPLFFVNAWKKINSPLNRLSPSQIKEREGCTLYLKKEGDAFVGGTRGKDCDSKIRKARYATTLTTVTDGEMLSWNQGFNAADQQVWGVEKGAYVFKRTGPAPSSP